MGKFSRNREYTFASLEDMITDMQLVDREYLNIYESLKTLNPDKTPKLTI